MSAFLDKIILFFKNLFKKEPVILRPRLEDLPLLVQKGVSVRQQDLDEFCAKKISEAKYLHSKAKGLLKAVNAKELEAKANERMNRAVETSKRQLITQMDKLLEKISPAEVNQEINSIREYAGKSEAVLVVETNTIRKNI